MKSRVDKRGEKVRAMFAGIAHRYDMMNHLLSLNVDRWWRRTTIRKAPPIDRAPILDVCTGTGDLAIGYAKAAGGACPILACDFCPEMLAIARKKTQAAGLAIEFFEADAQSLPLADDQCQIVAVAFGLRNVADTNKGLAEMIRVAKPGGRIVILEFSRPRLPLLKQLYMFYFRRILPCLGRLFARNKHDAYSYLPESVLEFPDGEAMAQLMSKAGLVDVQVHSLTLGIAALYLGTKPMRE